jgi:putative membrane protein
MKTVLRLLVLGVGLALFAWYVHRAGPGEIWQTVLRLGWLAPFVLIPYALTYGADTLGWNFAFGSRNRHGLGFRRLYRIRWCGEAVNNVIPSANIGGEATKVYLLRKGGVSVGDAAASVIVGRTVQTLTQVAFIALGSAAFLHIAGNASELRTGMAIILMVSVAAVATLFWLQTHGMFTLLLRLFDTFHWHLGHLEAKREHLQRIDRRVLEFYRNDRRHFLMSAGAYLAGWFLDTLDVFVVAFLLGLPITWLQALAIESFIGIAKLLGFLVPGALGVQESSIALVCRWAGLPDTFGAAYAIIRRGRDVVFASAGWWLLYAGETHLRGLAARVSAESGNDL